VQHYTDQTLDHGCFSSMSAGLCDILRNHTYVGMADDTLALIQHQTRLYLADANQLSRDLFYQQVMHNQ
jgi:DNA mismatch repair protein MLH1